MRKDTVIIMKNRDMKSEVDVSKETTTTHEKKEIEVKKIRKKTIRTRELNMKKRT